MSQELLHNWDEVPDSEDEYEWTNGSLRLTANHNPLSNELEVRLRGLPTSDDVTHKDLTLRPTLTVSPEDVTDDLVQREAQDVLDHLLDEYAD